MTLPRRLVTYAWLAWAVALTVASLQPNRFGVNRTVIGIHLHTVSHMLCFGVLTFLATIGLRRRAALWWIAPASVLFGAGIELIQHALYGSMLEWTDIRDDAAGVAIAVLIRFAVLRHVPE